MAIEEVEDEAEQRSSVRDRLQKNIFSAMKHSLIIFVELQPEEKKLNKLTRKKWQSFLCLTVTISKPIGLEMHLINEKEGSLKQKNQWPVCNLKWVNAKLHEKSLDFEMFTDSSMEFKALNYNDKFGFIKILYQLLQQYYPRNKVQFRDFKDAAVDYSKINESTSESNKIPDNGFVPNNEEEDLEKIFNENSSVLNNFDDFVESTNREIEDLELENIVSLFQSEQKCESTLIKLEDLLEKVEGFENTLLSYERAISHVRDAIVELAEDDQAQEIKRNNIKSLLFTLDEAFNHFEVDKLKICTIQSYTSGPPSKELCEAVYDLLSIYGKHPNLVLNELLSFKSRLNYYEEVRTSFYNKYINSFKEELNHALLAQSSLFESGGNVIPDHKLIHTRLLPFSSLIREMKLFDSVGFTQIQDLYKQEARSKYARNYHVFIENYLQLVKEKPLKPVMEMDFQNMIFRGKSNFYQERNFFTKFFMNATASNTDCDEKNTKKLSSSDNIKSKHYIKEVFLFYGEELKSLLDNFVKIYPRFCIFALAQIEKILAETSNVPSHDHLPLILESVKNYCMQNIELQVDLIVKQIREYDGSKKKKDTICPTHSVIEEFISNVYESYGSFTLNPELKRKISSMLIYHKSSVLSISKHTEGESKLDLACLNNLKIIQDMLYKYKLDFFAPLLSEIKNDISHGADRYVSVTERPLRKILNFFDGIDQYLKTSGTRHEDISRQINFSVMALINIIKETNIKESQATIESNARYLKKYIPDLALRTLLWSRLEHDCLNKLKMSHQYLSLCYKNEGIVIPLTMDELVNAFHHVKRHIVDQEL